MWRVIDRDDINPSSCTRNKVAHHSQACDGVHSRSGYGTMCCWTIYHSKAPSRPLLGTLRCCSRSLYPRAPAQGGPQQWPFNMQVLLLIAASFLDRVHTNHTICINTSKLRISRALQRFLSSLQGLPSGSMLTLPERIRQLNQQRDKLKNNQHAPAHHTPPVLHRICNVSTIQARSPYSIDPSSGSMGIPFHTTYKLTVCCSTPTKRRKLKARSP